jgi:DNA (cytosine-5)-methyltransferase 1
MSRPLLRDLFCGAGGCSVGYHRAGFTVIGYDNKPQPHYPFEFHRADALDVIGGHGDDTDVWHASPPCQRWSTSTAEPGRHPDLVTPIRALLLATGRPYVIENVPGAPLHAPIMLCGHAFGLEVRRHRLFESNLMMLSPGCGCDSGQPVGVYGHSDKIGHLRPDGTRRGRKAATLAEARAAMGIDWMTWRELAQAIPPPYTQFVGEQLLEQIGRAA